ncbi:MAG: hypothetical protein M0011_01965 [Elusimicrobia bacterium]|nr:hypothetical protein [Elusimicrobiota bacterium]
MSRNFRAVNLVCALALAAALFPAGAGAGWWIFGKASGRPEITKTFVGGVDLSGTDGKVALFRENLQDGKLPLKAFFRTAKNTPVAQARVSIDGGETWLEKVELDRDSLLLSFAPQEGKTYALKMIITDTKGQENDPADVPKVTFTYNAASAESLAARDLAALAKFYAARDLRGFTSMLAADYRGDRSSLEDAVAGDFRAYRQIDLEVIPQRALVAGPEARVRFRYNMSAVKAADGSVQKVSGETECTLKSEGGVFKLLWLQSPPIFGSTARSDENPSPGGVPVDSGGADTLSAALLPGVITGNASVAYATAGFKFSTQTNPAPAPGAVDVGVGPGAGYLLAYSAGSYGYIAYLGNVDLSTIGTISGMGTATEAPASNGGAYAILTEAGKYAVIQVTSINAGAATVSFKYMYQPDGSPRFR